MSHQQLPLRRCQSIGRWDSFRIAQQQHNNNSNNNQQWHRHAKKQNKHTTGLSRSRIRSVEPPNRRSASLLSDPRPASLEKTPRSFRLLPSSLNRLSSYRRSSRNTNHREEEDGTDNSSSSRNFNRQEYSCTENGNTRFGESIVRPRALRRWSNDPHRRDSYLLESPKLEQELLKRSDRRQRRSSLKNLVDNVLLRGKGDKRFDNNNNSTASSGGFDGSTDRDSTGGRNSCKASPSDSYRGDMNAFNFDDSISSSSSPPHNLSDEEVVLLLYRELQLME